MRGCCSRARGFVGRSVCAAAQAGTAEGNVDRTEIVYPAIESKMLADSLGYIKVETVTADRVKDVAAAIGSLQKQGATKLILDVRNSATGDPTDGVELANLFLDKGLITYTQGQKSPRKDFQADAKKAITTLPLVVVTNRGTAAAAEVAASALQGNKRAEMSANEPMEMRRC